LGLLLLCFQKLLPLQRLRNYCQPCFVQVRKPGGFPQLLKILPADLKHLLRDGNAGRNARGAGLLDRHGPGWRLSDGCHPVRWRPLQVSLL
jgi:hypothetical protein